LIRKAWDFCVRHHEGQMRASGEPYIVHPLEVGEVLAEMKMDSTAIAAGLLHDSVEDTPATNEEIEAEFGSQVAHIVEGVTNIDKIQFANREDRQAENVRKMLLAMVSDVRVVLIKLADRLHNMRTLEHLRPDRQEAIARETLEIYAPLAHRLGMGKVRGELEDLAFRYTDPVSYEQVSAAVESRRTEGEQSPSNSAKTTFRPASSGASSASTPSFKSSSAPRSASTRFMTCWPSASSPRMWPPATPSSVSSTRSGIPSPDASKTSSPCPAPTATSRCTPR
jgi:(p)ppGpp synthase/HD superfamily hydrolase